jgi:hypothetical protein
MDALEDMLPEITTLCVHVQNAYNHLQTLLVAAEAAPDDGTTAADETAVLQEFVVLQLLILAKVRAVRQNALGRPCTHRVVSRADARLCRRSRPSSHALTVPYAPGAPRVCHTTWIH